MELYGIMLYRTGEQLISNIIQKIFSNQSHFSSSCFTWSAALVFWTPCQLLLLCPCCCYQWGGTSLHQLTPGQYVDSWGPYVWWQVRSLDKAGVLCSSQLWAMWKPSAVMPCSHLQPPGYVRYVPGCHHKEEEGGRFVGPCCVEGSGL